MKVERRKISELKNDPANARKHSPRNLKAIRDSLDVFGQQKPIVIDSRGVVIAGNGTLEAARELGWDEITVAVTDLDPAHAQAFGIADNRTAELAEWDTDVLGQLLEGMDSDLADILSFDDFVFPNLGEEVNKEDINEETVGPSASSAISQIILYYQQDEYTEIINSMENLIELEIDESIDDPSTLLLYLVRQAEETIGTEKG